MVESSFLYGEDLSAGFAKLQDSEDGKSILKMINDKSKELEAIKDPIAFEQVVKAFEHRQYLTFSLSKVLKNALRDSDKSMVQLLLEQIGLDCSQLPLKNFLHSWLAAQCQIDKDGLLQGLAVNNNKEILKQIMFANPAIGLTKDEAYGNTPLHIACSLYSLDFA